MSEWQTRMLKDVDITFIDGDRGDNYPQKSDFNKEGYCLFLNTGNVTKLGFDFSDNDFISKEKDELLRKGKAKLNDIVLTTRGTVGNVGYLSEDIPYKNIRINSGMLILRTNPNLLNPYFLYLYLRSDLFKKQVLKITSGSAQPQLPISSLQYAKIIFPELKEQNKIVAVLSALDAKIDVNNRINAELEKLAKTIYDYWFVQFDFPNEDGKPYKASGGKMVYNNQLKREIPAGWEVKPISAIVNVTDGTHDSPKPCDTGFSLITSKHLLKTGIDFKSSYLISDYDYHEVNKRSRVESGDILISMIGTIGITYYVRETEINFAIKNMGLIKTSQNSNLSDYIYLYINSFYCCQYFISNISGSIQNYLTLGTLRNIPLLCPSENISKAFSKKVSSIFEKGSIIVSGS